MVLRIRFYLISLIICMIVLKQTTLLLVIICRMVIGWLNLMHAHQQLMFGMCTPSTLSSFFQHIFHVNIFLLHVKPKIRSLQRAIHLLLENCKLKSFVLGINTNNSFKAVYRKAAIDFRCAIFSHHRHIEDKIIDIGDMGAFKKK